MTNARASVVDTERDLVFEFFAAFARFEFALKRHPAYLEDKGYAAANWRAFAVVISNRFAEVHDADFRDAVRHLEAVPPKQQVVKSNALSWRDLKRDGKTTEQFVIECLKTVRNNLFHGGKFPEGPIADVARDVTLLKHCAVILRALPRFDPALRASVNDSS